MAQLIIDGENHGMNAFIVQLRSLEDHRVVPSRINATTSQVVANYDVYYMRNFKRSGNR